MWIRCRSSDLLLLLILQELLLLVLVKLLQLLELALLLQGELGLVLLDVTAHGAFKAFAGCTARPAAASWDDTSNTQCLALRHV